MKNVIFGSGIVGLAARKLLGSDWHVVPFARSRFYSYMPPLADNFIIRDDAIDKPMADLVGPCGVAFYKRAYSAIGQLTSVHDNALASSWLFKIFGDDSPDQALQYLAKRLVTPIYTVRTTDVYQALLNEYGAMLKAEAANGQITEIGPHYYVRNGIKTEFDNAISTIPLDVLVKLLVAGDSQDGGKDDRAAKLSRLKYADEHVTLVKSDRIDLEGCNQAWVVDATIDFYKVTVAAPGAYMFFFTREVAFPGAYLLPIIGPADVIDGTCVGKSIPVGQMPDLDWLADYGIFCVGSLAQHDWCADVGSNILRIVRYAQRGFKAK